MMQTLSFLKRFLCCAILLLSPLLVNIAQAATIEVTTIQDNGVGSLREALALANNTSESDEIIFNLSPEEAQYNPDNKTFTLFITSPLPEITAAHPITIDGKNQIVLDGSRSKSRFAGLTLRSSGHQVSQLTIQNFGGGGILVHGSDGQTVENVHLFQNRILDNGIFDENGNSGDGIRLAVNVRGSLVYDNLIARNRGNGLHLQSLTSAVWQNRVFGNFITANHKNGIRLEGSRNTLGINAQQNPSPNVITQNNLHGILINGDFGHGNHIAYDYIGLGPNENALGNRLDGIHLKAGAKNNRLGPGLKVYYNGGGIVLRDPDTRGNEITDSEMVRNLNEGLLLENIALEPVTKIQSNLVAQNQRDGIHLVGASPDIWSNHVTENQRYGVYAEVYDHDNPDIFEQNELTYAHPQINDNRITYNQQGGLYAIDTIFPEWDTIEERNELEKNTDFDALVQWYHVFGFNPTDHDFGALKVEISGCEIDQSPCSGNEIRENKESFFVGPDSFFNPKERQTFFKVTHFVVRDKVRSDYSPHKITVTGDQEKEFYLSDRDRARKILDQNIPLIAQSFSDETIEGPVHLTHFGNFGIVIKEHSWLWGTVFILTLFFLYHFWLAGHRIRSRERMFLSGMKEKTAQK